MEQRYNENGTITIWVNGAELRRMEGLDLVIFHTPGSSQVYTSDQPQFMYDTCVVDCQDILEALGYDESDGLDETDIAEITITV